MRAVDRGVVHLQQALFAQFCQQDLVQSGPYSGLGPVPQTPPGRHPAAAHPLRGDIPPAHALAQHVNDAPQSSAVIHRQPPGMPMPSRRSLREQRGYALPQIIWHKVSRHPPDPADPAPNCQATTPISF